ncbi:tripartite tricarboxylate transporter substrate binding protein [Rhodovarius lipocyclicus]|uniref:tripartite tricarboxylate transporter substrate binding protein n=1 Tax=Rhodovarius lipocyclicus TaxID=268410 RepID=UPI0013595DF5|nr:tripartite tricarboxylate transporter substrate binding protein [Rhodovarius lipocyclicus]
MQRRTFHIQMGAALAASVFAAPARAASLPALINLVVPFSSGGGADQLARDFAEAAGLRDSTIVVDNKPGANGAIATRQVARQRPDGTTILLGTSSTQALGPLFQNAAADPVNELAPITLLAETANALAVSADAPWRTLEEFLAAARRGALTYGTFGTGSSAHLYGVVLASGAGVELEHVPYRGSSQAMADLLGGHVQAVFLTTSALDGQARAGRVRVLAVTGGRRTGLFPDVPTFAEHGIRDLDFNGWFALFGPKGLDAEVTERFARISAELGRNTAFTQRMAQQGYDWVGSTPAQLEAEHRRSVSLYRRILAANPITP